MKKALKIAFQGEFEDDFYHRFSPPFSPLLCEEVVRWWSCVRYGVGVWKSISFSKLAWYEGSKSWF